MIQYEPKQCLPFQKKQKLKSNNTNRDLNELGRVWFFFNKNFKNIIKVPQIHASQNFFSLRLVQQKIMKSWSFQHIICAKNFFLDEFLKNFIYKIVYTLYLNYLSFKKTDLLH
jgi:hypothetical protein